MENDSSLLNYFQNWTFSTSFVDDLHMGFAMSSTIVGIIPIIKRILKDDSLVQTSKKHFISSVSLAVTKLPIHLLNF